MQLKIYNGFNKIKQGDTKSKFEFQLLDYEDLPIDLTGKTVSVIVANSIGKILEKAPTIDDALTGVISFVFDDTDVTGYGDMRLEVHVTDADGALQIVPSDGYYKFVIGRSLNDASSGVTNYTLQYFTGQFDAKMTELDTSMTSIGTATTSANDAASAANTATVDANNAANNANAKATLAEEKATLADTKATAANNAADTASLAAFNANTKATAANDAASAANIAKTNADAATTAANNAANSVNTAITNAESATTAANTSATNADTATTAANTAATNANEKATFAQEQGDFALQVGTENKTRFLNAVDTVATRDTTYPTPTHGDTVRVTSEAKSYRYVDGTGWVVTDEYNPTAIDQVASDLAQNDQQVNERIDNIVSGVTQETELIDSRHSSAKNKLFNSLDDRLEELENDMQFSDINTSKVYSYKLKQQDGHMVFVYEEVL